MTAQPNSAHPHATTSLALAWMVHAYTASGAVLAFAMTLAIIHAQFRFAFVLMVVATVIDSTDGVLARIARVKERTPAFDGARLDDIVDYLTFVFVPALLIVEAGLLPRDWSAMIVAVVLLSSAYGFSAADAKTSDHFFTGFPSYWNIVALYLFASHLPPTVNALILLGLSVLVFVRIGYVYPSRTPVLRGLTIALCGVWGVMIIVMIVMLPEVSRLLLLTSLFFPLYYVVLSLLLQRRRMRRA